MVDLGALATNINSISNIVLVNPKNNIGIRPKPTYSANGGTTTATPAPPPSFLFHYNGEESVTLTTEVTDHFVEDNTTIQDQAALKPETISVHGYIGELNNVPPPALVPLKFAADKLTNLSPYVPALSASALIAYNAAQQAYAAAVNAANAVLTSFNTISGNTANPVQNEQQKAFTLFYGYWKARQLFSVQTPWAIFEDMIIQSLRAVQTEETNVISEFEITFKKIRFAKGIVSVPVGQGRNNAQSSALQDKGVSKPTPSIAVADALKRIGLLA